MNNIEKLGRLEIDLEELRDFIVEGKKNCYAGNGKEIILPDGSKLLTFQEGNLYYEDNYSGYYQAPGRELVKWKNKDGQRIWQMAYSGGMIDLKNLDKDLVERAFAFLKKVLSKVPREEPFRGPKYFASIIVPTSTESFAYHNKPHSDAANNLIRFKGEEEIIWGHSGRFSYIFSQDYSGGLIIPK